jgi:glucose/arabinose dehydrogenase
MRRPLFATALVLVALVAAGCGPGTGDATPSTSILTTTSPTTTTAPPPSTSTTTTSSPTTTEATTTTVPIADLEITVTEIATGFEAPVLLVADPDGGSDLVVEQPGRIRRVDDGTVVVDLTADVAYGGEQGLLGLAFHPRFAENRLAFVDYTGAGGTTVIERFAVGPDGTFDVASRTPVLEIPQPAPNHNGGMIAFGPDGNLWIGMGDGGGAGDRYDQAQRPDTLLGAMLRIAVDGVDAYAIPSGNPFADGAAGAPEVWAIGLRNPWRFAFDGEELWIGDVGQGAVEEIDRVPVGDGGLNFGWPIMEGTSCYRDETCDPTPFVTPVSVYGHDQGCSITGGVVYRGSAIPELDGHYLFSDYCAGFLRTYSDATGVIDWTAMVGSIPAVTAFGVGGDGEVRIVSSTGSILRLDRAG